MLDAAIAFVVWWWEFLITPWIGAATWEGWFNYMVLVGVVFAWGLGRCVWTALRQRDDPY